MPNAKNSTPKEINRNQTPSRRSPKYSPKYQRSSPPKYESPPPSYTISVWRKKETKSPNNSPPQVQYEQPSESQEVLESPPPPPYSTPEWKRDNETESEVKEISKEKNETMGEDGRNSEYVAATIKSESVDIMGRSPIPKVSKSHVLTPLTTSRRYEISMSFLKLCKGFLLLTNWSWNFLIKVLIQR